MRLMLLIGMVFLVFLVGCQTFEGLGKDMKKAGDWIEEKAK